MRKLYNFLYNLKRGTEELNYGRDIIVKWAEEYAINKKELKILDLGLGKGEDLLNIRKCKDIYIELYGLESYEPNIIKAQQNNINVCQFNLENNIFPYKDGSFDIIIANQVLEHTKEIFWIFSEVSRVLKKDSIFIIGVPNLASLHNRIALLVGMQPPSIKVLGPHVRGYVEKSFIEFIEADDYFKCLETKGSNFYPFPEKISRILSKNFKKYVSFNILFSKTYEKKWKL